MVKKTAMCLNCGSIVNPKKTNMCCDRHRWLVTVEEAIKKNNELVGYEENFIDEEVLEELFEEKGTRMNIIYIAGPYTAPSKQIRDKFIKIQHLVGSELIKSGFATIIPCKNTLDMENNISVEEGYPEIIYEMDIVLMSVCHHLVLTEGWKNSIGCLEEIEWWKANKDPEEIYYWPDKPELPVR